MLRWAHPHHGRLLTPRHYNAAAQTAAAGIAWAVDNDAYNGLDLDAYERMVEHLAGLPGCRFVAVPDVVGDAWLTLHAYWEEYASLVWRWRLPPAYVLQDGLQDVGDVPWGSCAAPLPRRQRRLPPLRRVGLASEQECGASVSGSC